MSEPFATNAILLRQILLEDGQTIEPDTAGFPAPIGSMLVEHGVYPTTPTDMWLKSLADDHGWLKQNLTGIRTFNVKDPIYGAVGDGITDDRVAIQAAVDACQAAGGGIVYFPPTAASYLITKGPLTAGGAYESIAMDNYHNITLMGDGAASKLTFVDDAGGLTWIGVLAHDGSTNIAIYGLNFNGSGMTNIADPSVMISFNQRVTDTISGQRGFRVEDCILGPATRRCIQVFADADNHRVNDIQVDRCTIDQTLTGSSQSALVFLQNFDHAVVRHNHGVAGAGSGSGSVINLNNNAQVLPADIWDWRVSGNHCERLPATATAIALIQTGGAEACHNTITSGTATYNGTINLKHHILRGNVFVLSGANAQGAVATVTNLTAAVQDSSARGNVCVRQDYTGTGTGCLSSLNVGGLNTAIAVNDNIAEHGATTSITLLSIGSSSTGSQAVMSGNIGIAHGTLAGQGSGLFTSPGAGAASPVLVSAIGNLLVSVEGNAPLNGMSLTTIAGQTTNLSDIRFNLASGFQRFAVFAGTRSQWVATFCNNLTPSAAVSPEVVSPPSGATGGYTADANAGASPQVMAHTATFAGNVGAKKGSLGACTVGAQGTTLLYKQTDDGTVLGGAAGWFGIAGYEITFGSTGGSTTATALYLAGGMALPTPIATEIQYAMPRPGLLRNFRLRCTAGTGAGTVTYVVRKNGVNTAITIAALANAGTNSADTTNSVSVAQGDLVSLQNTKAGTITTAQTLIRSVMELAS